MEPVGEVKKPTKRQSRTYRVKTEKAHYSKLKSACLAAEKAQQGIAAQALWTHFCEKASIADMATIILNSTRAQQVTDARAELERIQKHLERLASSKGTGDANAPA